MMRLINLWCAFRHFLTYMWMAARIYKMADVEPSYIALEDGYRVPHLTMLVARHRDAWVVSNFAAAHFGANQDR